MFYEKLAREYADEAKILKNYITKLKEDYAQELNTREVETCRRVSILYDMYLDLKYMGNFLKSRSEDENYGKISKI